jgi:signal transduction histidine kinase/ligand-binding sensor domain-containing protein
VWVGTDGGPSGTAKLCAIQNLEARCEPSEALGQFVISLQEDRSGRLWVGASTGLWRWKPAPAVLYPLEYEFSEVRSIIEDGDGILVASNREIKRSAGQRLETFRLPGDGQQIRPTTLFRDREGGLWIGTQDQGLFHVHERGVDRFDRNDGLSGDFVTTLSEDREGNVWVATLNGIDRFRAVAVTRISTKQGLSSGSVLSVLATKDGSIWFSAVDGLNHWKDGRVTHYGVRRGSVSDAAASLFQDTQGRLTVASPRGRLYPKDGPFDVLDIGIAGYGYVSAITQDTSGRLWLSDQSLGLFQLKGRNVVAQIPWTQFGRGPVQALAADPVDGGVWLGFFQGGVSYLKNGQLRASYAPEDGLGQGKVSSLLFDEVDGALWAATQGGLSRLQNGTVATITSRNGLLCDTVHWVIEDLARALWLRTACGLVRITRAELDNWVRDPDRTIRLTTYDGSDGLPDHSDLGSFSPNVARGADGRLWFVTYDGMAVVDPARVPTNSMPPPVHVEQIAADGVVLQAPPRLNLPPRVRDLRIDYTAISLVAPEKVRFRYRLEGRDEGWIDAGDRRQAFYTDLPPNSYRFRVIASNNDGVWNETGDVWEFSILPMFYQTRSFRVAMVLGGFGLLWALYTVRLQRVAAQMRVRFEERLAERTRIAQDLHDTLLQGSLSASMQLHVLATQVEDTKVRTKLERIVQRFSDMIEEGRRTVQDLRASPRTADDLEQALARAAEDLRGEQHTDIRIAVQGRKRPLHPLIRDECYRIAREALANTFRHAHATRVDIDVEYASDQVCLRIRDNGRGIDRATLELGRPGHWGLQGMRERAEHVGGSLNINSRPNRGTEVELMVPGRLAFRPAIVGARDRQKPTIEPDAEATDRTLAASLKEALPRLSLRWLSTRLRL